MNYLRKISSTACHIVIAAICTTALAQSAKVEHTGPPPAATSTEIKAAVEDKGYRVTLDDGWTADLWFVKELKLTKTDSPGALYPELSNSEFVGLISLPKGMTDFRGQAIPAGIYTLRYQLLPADGNHLGVSPNPDFLLAIPIANDAKPEAQYSFDKLVALSAKSTGAHPGVIAMEKAAEPGTASLNDQNMLVMTVSVGAAKPEKLGLVLKGQAAQ
jgi:hypothetical protein